SVTIHVSALIPADYLGPVGNGTGNNLQSLFEIDGNTVDGAAPGDDWNTLFDQNGNPTGNGSAEEADFVHDLPAKQGDSSTFTGGGSKDILDLNNWQSTAGSVPPQDDILNAYAARDIDPSNGDLLIYFGQDRGSTNGDAQMGVWFFQEQVVINGSGAFVDATNPLLPAHHQVGDILILANFSNGGKIGTTQVYEWDPTNPAAVNNLVLLNSTNL